MKYIAIIDTDDYKDFKFFEDADGEYLAVRDVNAKYNEWICLRFTQMESEGNMTFEEVKELFKKSIDTTDTINQAIENIIQSIYLKGYNDALQRQTKSEESEDEK